MSLNRNVSRRGVLASASCVALGASATLSDRAFADETGDQGEEVQKHVSQEVIDFLYIDSADMYTGDVQNIAVALRGFASFASASLTVRNVDADEQHTLDLVATADNSMLFSFMPENPGAYEITSLSFVCPDASGTVDFSDADTSYRSFTAESAVNTLTIDGEGDDDSLSLKVYSAGDDAEPVESESIEDGISAAGASAASMARSMSRSGATTVIALDPGHVGVSSGAVAFGTQEAEATWKIAQYCKAELETYDGVSVFLTVQKGESISSSNDLSVRVQRAVDRGADVLVSLHLNSTGTGAGHGAEVWAPADTGYNHQTHEVGTALANKILAQLERLGLTNRGTKFRVISNNGDYAYPDGTDGDYYGIIRNARKANLPAIIVEHAFLDNANDYNRFLNSDAKLQSLGVADATGIAHYFGLGRGEGTVYRLYYAPTLDHHYTMDLNEYRILGQRGWEQEGTAWKSPETSSKPVYRLYYAPTLDHHYTSDKNEYEVLASRGWEQEGVAWYSDEEKGAPVYRLYYAPTYDHHYTMDKNEYEVLAARGWEKEGVAWYSQKIE